MTGYMDAECFNVLEPPGPVQSPITISSTETEITIGWGAPTTGGAYTGVRVYYNDTGITPDPETDTPDDTVPAGTLTYTLSGLDSSERWYFYLYAENGAGYSTVVSANTYTLPPPVLGFQRSGMTLGTLTTIVLDWGLPGKLGGYSGVTIFVTTSPTPPSNPASGGEPLDENATTYTWTGLTQGISYYGYAFSRFADSGFYSVPQETGQMVITVLPGTPVGQSSDNVTSTTFDVLWSAPATGTVTQYYICWSDSDASIPDPLSYIDTQVVDSNTFTLTISGLTPEITYYYWIWAANLSGVCETPAAGDETTTPEPPGTPTGLSQTGNTETTLTIGWSVGALADSTLVWYSTENTFVPVPGTTTPDYIVTAPTDTQTITGLTANTEYWIHIGSKRTAGGVDLYSGTIFMSGFTYYQP
jgi:hypothetical protein